MSRPADFARVPGRGEEASEMMRTGILIGIGANLVPDGYASARDGCEAAIAQLADAGIEVAAVSPWYETAPVPVSDQPWFNNAVIAAHTHLSVDEALVALHRIEAGFGRVRTIRNAARVLDLDLLDYGGIAHDQEGITVPHPRLHERAFVLLPLRDVVPDYRHPVSGLGIDRMIASLPPDQQIRKAD